MAKNKIIKGVIPYSDLNQNLNFEPDEETKILFEKLLDLVDKIPDSEKQKFK
ncbi:hypothetical protein WIW50_02755 [Flavobacteriaceae bacterium 3-367]